MHLVAKKRQTWYRNSKRESTWLCEQILLSWWTVPLKCTRSKSPQNNLGQASSSNFGSLTSGPLKGLNILGVVGDQQVNKSCLLMWRLPLAYIYPRQHFWARAVLAVVRPRTHMAQVKNRVCHQAKNKFMTLVTKLNTLKLDSDPIKKV